MNQTVDLQEISIYVSNRNRITVVCQWHMQKWLDETRPAVIIVESELSLLCIIQVLDKAGKVIKELSGNMNNTVVRPNGQEIKLTFYTDSSVQRFGWLLTWTGM